MADPYEIAGEVEKRARIIFSDALKKVIIYGSYATGTNDSESDLDILLLVSESDTMIENRHDEIMNITAEISSRHNIFVSVMVRNITRFDERSSYVPFYMNVARNGIEIHG